MKGIEKSFLSNWSGWDEVDTGDFQFYNVNLNDETVNYIGDKELVARIDSMYFSSQYSKVEFYDSEGEPVFSKEVKLVFV